MPALKRKVFAYVTHRDRLLLFTHPNAPEAGIQVPAGMLEEGEEPEAGALREATEETGLTGLRVVAFLGEQQYCAADLGKDEIHHRYFFHLTCQNEPPERWRHGEVNPSDGGPPIPFDFFWARLPDQVPELIADHGYYLPALLESESWRRTTMHTSGSRSEVSSAAITPTLSVRDGTRAIVFYKEAFGATELMRVTSPDGEIVAELSIGGARFFVADESPDNGNRSPESLGGTSVRIALLVADPDTVQRRAVAAGAREVYPVADQDYGYRLGRVADPFGHHWEICRPLG